MPQIIDSTVSNQAYDTSGNGGRKLVLLSNGWLVAGVIDSITKCVKIYSSEDNGQTWDEWVTGSTRTSIQSMALCAKGNTVYIMECYNNSVVTFFKLDLDDTNLSDWANLEVSQTALGNVSLAINEAGTELHATWSSKNSQYPNSFNIRYAKGVINADGSVTWGAVEQLTKMSASTAQFNSPTIGVKDGQPFVVFTYNDTYPEHRVNIMSPTLVGKDGGAVFENTVGWGHRYIYNGGTYNQSSPSAIFVPQSVNGLANGRIWVAWHGMDSIDTARNNICLSYSDDGGVTWSSMQKLTSGNTYYQMYPTLTANSENNIFVLFQGSDAGCYNIYKMNNNGSGWSTKTQITNNTTANVHAERPSSLFDLSLDFTEPLFIYKDNEPAKVGFYGTWTVTNISVPQGTIGKKSDRTNLLTYNITTDGTMSKVTEKVNGVTVGTKTLANGEETQVSLTQEQWDAVRFGKYVQKNLMIPFKSENFIYSNPNATYSFPSSDRLEILSTDIAYVKTKQISVKPSTNYTLSLNLYNGAIWGLEQLDSTVALINDGYFWLGQTDTTKTFKTLPNAYYVIIYLGYGGGSTKAIIENVMLQEGTEQDTYVPPSQKFNTLTIEMGSEKWEYTFDKRPSENDDILSAVKAVKDANKVFLPSVKAQLASAIRSKGGTVNDTDLFDAIMRSISGIPSGRKSADGQITLTGGQGTFTVGGLDFTPRVVIVYYNSGYFAIGFTNQSDNSNYGINMYNYSLSSNTFTPTNNGFTLRFAYYGVAFNWVAYE